MSVKNAKKEESFIRRQSFSEDPKTSYPDDGKVQSSVSNSSPSKTSRDVTEASFFVRVDSTNSFGSILSISTPQKRHPYLALDMNGSLPKLKVKIETLETELGKINPKDLEPIKKVTARLDFLNKANEILKSTPEISPLFLLNMVEAALSDQPDQTNKALKGLEVLQRLRAREESRQQLVLRVVQEYPEASPLVGEVDFSRQNPRVLPYHSNGYLTPQQLAAVYQPPIGTLQASPLGLAYDDLKMAIPQSADEVQSAFIRLIRYQTSPFSLGSVEAIEEEITRIETVTDPLISNFLFMVEDQRKKLLKKEPQVQINEEFRGRVAAVSPHFFILSVLESSPENFQANGESLESYRSYFLNLRKKLQAEYETTTSKGEMFLPNGDWEKSSAKKISDRLRNVDQAIASIDSMSDATSEAAMLRYARVRLDFELKENEPFLVKAVENKLKQVEEIPSSLKNSELKEIRENFLASRNLSPQERIQFYAKTFGELDSIAFPRTVNVKLEMLNAGKETVGVTDRTVNWLVNIPRRSIGGEKDSIELSNQRSTLEITQKRYQEVQDLMNAGKIDEAKKLFLSLEQSTLMATAADRVEFSTSFNRYAVGLGLVAAAGAVGYTAGAIAEPIIGGELNLLLVNASLFWGTLEYLDAKTKGLEVNPFYHAEEDAGQNAFRITKGILYTYGALKFIGMVNKNYWEVARVKLFAQAEKEMLAEGTLTEAAAKGSVEEGCVAARASAIQSQFFTQVKLHAGAYAHEVLALGGWEFTQANIDFALEKQFHPIVAATHTLFSLDGWKHRAVFVAGLKLEGKVSQNLGYRQIAELIRDQGYQIKFNALENQIRTAEFRLQEFQKLAETDPEKLPPPEKLLPFLASYRKGLEQQLEMAKNLSARGIELDGLQYLSNRATELLQLKALEAFTQARANYFKQNGIDLISKNLYRYAADRGLELVTRFRKEGKEIEIGENGILSIKQGDETLRLIPSKQPSQNSLAQMRKVLFPSELQNSALSRLVDGVMAVFEESTVVKLALAGALPFLAGNSSPIQDAPTWVNITLVGVATLILGGLAIVGWKLNKPTTSLSKIPTLNLQDFSNNIDTSVYLSGKSLRAYPIKRSDSILVIAGYFNLDENEFITSINKNDESNLRKRIDKIIKLEDLVYEGHRVSFKIDSLVKNKEGKIIGFISEKVPGDSLFNLSKAGKLTQTQLEEIKRQISEQLKLIHQAGEFFGDNFLHNILVHVDSNNKITARLIDFGENPNYSPNQTENEKLNETFRDLTSSLADKTQLDAEKVVCRDDGTNLSKIPTLNLQDFSNNIDTSVYLSGKSMRAYPIKRSDSILVIAGYFDPDENEFITSINKNDESNLRKRIDKIIKLEDLVYEGHRVSFKINFLVKNKKGNIIGFISEKVPGDSLFNLSKAGKLTQTQLEEIKRQISEQLKLIHQAGELFGDSFLHNILVHVDSNNKTTARLIDFGENPNYSPNQTENEKLNEIFRDLTSSLADKTQPDVEKVVCRDDGTN